MFSFDQIKEIIICSVFDQMAVFNQIFEARYEYRAIGLHFNILHQHGRLVVETFEGAHSA